MNMLVIAILSSWIIGHSAESGLIAEGRTEADTGAMDQSADVGS